MNGTSKISGLIALLFVGGFIVIFVSINIISSMDLSTTDSVPIYTGVIGFFVTIITTIYKENSERYAEKRAHAQKRWELVFPILKDSYIPWINSAIKLRGSLNKEKIENLSDHNLNRILYFVCLFSGIRLRFIIKHGGSILLGTKTDEKNVKAEYKKVKDAFQWAGNKTPSKVSALQEYFLRNDKEDNPLVFKNFEDVLKGIQPTPPKLKPGESKPEHQPEYKFGESKTMLKNWLNSDASNPIGIEKALGDFIDVFDTAISDFSGRED